MTDATVLHCYVNESFVSRIWDWNETSDALADAARQAGFRPGCIVVEEQAAHDGMPSGLKTLVRAALETPGTVAVAVPHLGHLMVHGDPYGWRAFVERVTGRPLVVLRETRCPT
ncbi:hypothetical protein [Kribbella sp. CA-247076]|uniref:hypothetical protein n=1 Tax=Kribbella sp. CA-247076 TaxID=3239941 RepID=UPI003D8D87DA